MYNGTDAAGETASNILIRDWAFPISSTETIFVENDFFATRYIRVMILATTPKNGKDILAKDQCIVFTLFNKIQLHS